MVVAANCFKQDFTRKGYQTVLGGRGFSLPDRPAEPCGLPAHLAANLEVRRTILPVDGVLD